MKKTVSLEDRREILKKGSSLLGVSLCATAVSSLLSGCEKDTLKTSDEFEAFEISEEPDLLTVGGAAKRTFGHQNGGRPVIIVRLDDTDFVAMTAVCTHLQCEINLPSGENENLQCPCHKSEFLPSTGEVKKGPAGAPLQSFNAIFEGDVLKILF
ncbi:ubiquinol-cytochrome c reductase iron-sulfur subunit [Candidatus Latescibacterota bacterium]